MLDLYMRWIGFIEKAILMLQPSRPIRKHAYNKKWLSRAAVAIQSIHVQLLLAQVERVNCSPVHSAMKQYVLLYISNGCRYAE